MTLDHFWNIIEDVHRSSDGDMDAKCELLSKKLHKLTLDEVRAFGEHFTEQYYRAYDWGLWAAAYIIGHGCSDDSFMDFRSTLISMGRETFERALADPESLADMDYDPKNAHYEGFQYVRYEVFKEMSGGQELTAIRSHPKEPTGYDWPESKVGRLYPKLATKFNYSDCPAPRLFQEKEFTAASFAAAVNHFVILGENAAIQELRRLATDSLTDYKRGFTVYERVGWICRVLFDAKTESLRPPDFGRLHLPYHTMPDKSWPLYPVALSGSTFFVLSEGYSLADSAEDPNLYIEHCRQAGIFRKNSVIVPTKSQALSDATALRQSAAWKAIKWTDSGQNWSYTMDEGWTWDFVQKQAESIRW